MEVTRTFHTADRARWRAWLRAHHRTAKEIWLVYYRKESGRPRISYNDAVEEALCFGWIDSTMKKVDERRMAQRFTPRRAGSPYSQANRERLRALIAARRVSKPVLDSLPKGLLATRVIVAADVREALEATPPAWGNFRRFSAAYRRIRLAFVEGARSRPAEFQKRLGHLVRRSARNEQFGFGGVEKHYQDGSRVSLKDCCAPRS